MSKAVIFDFDGVIAETEPLQLDAYNCVLAQLNLPRLDATSFTRDYVGLPTHDIFEKLRTAFEISVPTDELVRLKESSYESIVNNARIELAPGLVTLLNDLEARGWKFAIASSSPPKMLHLFLESIFKIDRYFPVVVSSHDVSRGKPAPDIYESVISRLDIKNKDRLVVIEDSQAGLAAAKQAGLKCVIVPSRFTKDHNFSQCDLRIGQLTGLNHAVLMKLIRPHIVYVPKSDSGYCKALECVIDQWCSGHADFIPRPPIKDEDLHSQVIALRDAALEQASHHHAADAVIVVPISDVDEIRRNLLSIAQEGTTVVTVDQNVDLDPERKCGAPLRYYGVVADCRVGGELAADALARAMNNEGSFAVISGPKGLGPSRDRRSGFLDRMAEHAPKVRLEGVEYTNWYSGEGAQIAQRFIIRHVKVDGIFCACDNLAMEVADTYAQAKIDNQVTSVPIVVGFDGIPEVYQYIMDDRILATIDVDVAYQGHVAYQAAIGKEPHDRVITRPKLLNKAEIKRQRSRNRCFISYAHEDHVTAEDLERRLSEAGFRVFIDTREIHAGERFVNRWRELISQSATYVIVLSPHSVRSRYVRDELEFAVGMSAKGKLAIVPLRMSGDYEIPALVQGQLYIEIPAENGLLDERRFCEVVRVIDGHWRVRAPREIV